MESRYGLRRRSSRVTGSPVGPAKLPILFIHDGFLAFMSYFVCILQSDVDGSYYVGYTYDTALRLVHHNDGWTISTKGKRPWKIVYTEEYGTKTEAIKREKEIKRKKSRSYIESLIHAGGRPV